jgi:hypothetical protein
MIRVPEFGRSTWRPSIIIHLGPLIRVPELGRSTWRLSIIRHLGPLMIRVPELGRSTLRPQTTGPIEQSSSYIWALRSKFLLHLGPPIKVPLTSGPSDQNSWTRPLDTASSNNWPHWSEFLLHLGPPIRVHLTSGPSDQSSSYIWALRSEFLKSAAQQCALKHLGPPIKVPRLHLGPPIKVPLTSGPSDQSSSYIWALRSQFLKSAAQQCALKHLGPPIKVPLTSGPSDHSSWSRPLNSAPSNIWAHVYRVPVLGRSIPIASLLYLQ